MAGEILFCRLAKSGFFTGKITVPLTILFAADRTGE